GRRLARRQEAGDALLASDQRRRQLERKVSRRRERTSQAAEGRRTFDLTEPGQPASEATGFREVVNAAVTTYESRHSGPDYRSQFRRDDSLKISTAIHQT